MNRSEYKEIIQEMKANTFSYTYQSQNQSKPHEEEIEVIAWEDIVEILEKYVQSKE